MEKYKRLLAAHTDIDNICSHIPVNSAGSVGRKAKKKTPGTGRIPRRRA